MRLATSANIPLYGLQTIDGVLTQVGDRVLVKDQADQTQNGIYTASEGQWFRAADARTARTLQKGTTVHVQEGITNPGKTFVFQSINLRVGTDAVTIAFYHSDDTISEVNAAVAAGIASVEAASEDLIAQAETARDAAIAAAAGVNLPPVTANTMLIDNAVGTAREAKTFAAVRTKLQSIAFTELPVVEAWNNGIPGDATDQTARLALLINSLPPEGGNILLKGDVRVTTLAALQGKHNIRLMGLGGLGTGSAQQTYLRSAAGAGVGRVVDCRDTFNVSFERLWIEALDKTVFNASLIDYGFITTGSAYMHMTDCFVMADSGVAGCRGVNLYGATQGSFKDVSFNGKAASGVLALQDINGVGFCNAHTFTSCQFKGASSNYPVHGAGEGLTFTGCNVQAGADGVGRFWSGSTVQDFRGVDIIGCTFYDQLAGGGEWIAAYRGNALNVIGCRFGGYDTGGAYSAAIRLGGAAVGNGNDGVHGVNIIGNNFDHCSPAVAFTGVIANRTHAQEVHIANNHFVGLTNNLVGSIVLAQRLTFGPNNINGATGLAAANVDGRYVQWFGGVIPAFAGAPSGLSSGTLYYDTSAGNVVKIVP
ncbi:hypothetical protein EN836_26580 [Mesorhizobium sp. M1C.F.Ca.ET.193.01.1.1]|uniref:hypothetical protein n=3 Tax=Mesorhizobium TaxID=68287 RepID=UPI000FD4F7DF|nr:MULTISPECIES: hypothetical protein [unclassified Mesorhizobium]TGS93880.1 hypothetical protein EN820_47245 [bacterium M00.F.Ca.ET.177.01.1.1]TGQ50945.1 hypothetical protein EN853_26575 [Mesorhizobium sp. M1C.F.Ca.ET.210.01.1.1]TGQ66382.1 hypothetical protein EN855_026585 [Mesorhizobium sp. M1C.F.Ca.ET.212.01.1.1]TGR00468.1 hypothetical protein EN847_26575 [Mesorhizobium sp. M1C.F.Ca.ET.204.01.1.1]TGR21059.1 hypothetical protein EN839_26575 [Mesorhizobium sp. M1C.F.Ca.ET.196.01.1.1]